MRETSNHDINIIICGLRDLDRFIDRGRVDAVISIMNPDAAACAPRAISAFEYEHPDNVLRLAFDDVWSENYSPGLIMVSEVDLTKVFSFVSDLIDWCEDSITLLVHCHEGISRSSAVAIAIYTFVYGNPNDAATRISRERPHAAPNIEVIRLSDRLLKLDGQLLSALEQEFYGTLMDVVDFT